MELSGVQVCQGISPPLTLIQKSTKPDTRNIYTLTASWTRQEKKKKKLVLYKKKFPINSSNDIKDYQLSNMVDVC